MTASSPSEEKQAHRLGEARRWCDAADRNGAEGGYVKARAFAAVSQAHASIAIAEQLERLNETLGLTIELDPTRGIASQRQVVRVRNV